VSDFKFDVLATDGAARRGRLTTAHGVIDTPAFMPVGTAATVKAMLPESVAATGAQIILANTYHLMLRPGAERIAKFGGVRKFMNWPGPLLTDSGGYQVMSLAKLRKMDENGVTFQSHIDGAKHLLTPERSIAIQHDLDATITMAFDECTPFPAEKDAVAESMALSMRAGRSVLKTPIARAKVTACSASFKAGSTPTCARNPPAICRASVSTATPSAASPSAKART
jgi:queuine tRNA-ribosyltransferase